jgi:MFS family permease
MVFLGGMAVGTTPLFMGTIPLETVPPRDAAAASGLVLGVGQVVGGFSGPAGAGILADRFSLAVPLWISVVMALAAVLTSLWLQETAPAKLARSTPRASL